MSSSTTKRTVTNPYKERRPKSATRLYLVLVVIGLSIVAISRSSLFRKKQKKNDQRHSDGTSPLPVERVTASNEDQQQLDDNVPASKSSSSSTQESQTIVTPSSSSSSSSSSSLKESSTDVAPDPAGYFVCGLTMGRFGNQVEHLVGLLSIAKETNRTLVLPPFISYCFPGKCPFQNGFIGAEDVFDLDELKRYYRKIIPMRDFMAISDVAWPEDERTVYCLGSRGADVELCGAYRGNPFESFWRYYKVQFVSEHKEGSPTGLNSLNPKQHHVVATIGPGSLGARFPMTRSNWPISRYFKWHKNIEKRRTAFLKDSVMLWDEDDGVSDDSVILVAVHLRAGSDWVKACEHGVGMPEYMASPQCADEKGGRKITQEMCLPSANMSQVLETLQGVAEKAKKRPLDTYTDESRNDLPKLVLYIASDVDWVKKELTESLGQVYDRIVQYREEPSPSSQEDQKWPLSQSSSAVGHSDIFLDLVMLTYADYFIGNCVSSFTSLVTRMRREQGVGVETAFFGL